MNDDDDYAEFVADMILAYLAQQQSSGRVVVKESEIWQLLGQPFPEDREDQVFELNKYINVRIDEDNVVSLDDYKKKKLH